MYYVKIDIVDERQCFVSKQKQKWRKSDSPEALLPWALLTETPELIACVCVCV